MPDKNESNIMSCDIVIKGQIPKEAFELFAAAQAKTIGLRGYISQVDEETWKGVLQGEGKIIETFKTLVMAAAEYVEAVKEFVIQNLKAIQEYTYKTFEVKTK